ncbi:MAG: flavodoxin family protein [Bacteroidales bacterium]
MKHICIVYQSKTGTTKRFAKSIAGFFNPAGFNVKVFSVENADYESIGMADILFLGCWTSGAFIILQKPDKEWKTFACNLKNIDNKRIVLFTTYKIATGSMFRNMKKYLKVSKENDIFYLKSRTGNLDKTNQERLNKILVLN